MIADSSKMKNLITIITLTVIALFNSLALANPKVAVLVEPGMINYSGQPTLTPQKVMPMLDRFDIEAMEITADQMDDPIFFNVSNFSAIVMFYGNAFPLVGYENLRTFHAEGGALVVNGIPFTHPAERVNNKWKDKGHMNYLFHDDKGIGTGNFLDGPAGIAKQRIADDNPLKLLSVVLPRDNAHLQYLDAGTLPDEDIIIPLVETMSSNGTWEPAAAIIKHKCNHFNNASVLWLGQVGNNLDETDYYYLKQVFTRGIAYILKEKKCLSESRFCSILEQLDNEVRPELFIKQITASATPRPWGNTFLPKSKTPADHLFAVDADNLSDDIKIALGTLQGLTARNLPEIWLNFKKESGPFWLDWHQTKGYIKSYEKVDDWKSLFTRFSDSYKGAVIPDPQLYQGILLAVNAASCEDLIILTPELAKELNIPIKIDLRNKFKTYAEGMKWVWDNYRDKLNHHLCDIIHPSWVSNTAFSYDIQWRGIVFWISGPVDSVLAGADPLEEMKVMSEIFAAMPPNTAVLGFPWCGDGVGLGEVGGTSFCGSYGKSLVCTDHLPNLTVMSGVTLAALKQKKQPPAPTLEKDKIYIALAYSDGDNQNLWMTYFKKFFDSKEYGRFPVSFGMGPAIHDLQPAVAQWYYENASPTTEFISDVSGIGYMRPDDYATQFIRRDEVFDGFVGWTSMYLDKMDMKTLRTVSGGDDSLKPYIKGIPQMHSLFADMGCYSGKSDYDELTYTMDDMIIFRAQTTWGQGPSAMVNEIRQRVGDTRPAFVNSLVHCWTFQSLESLKENFVDKMDDDMILVTPAQLAQLYEQAQQKPR